MVEKKLKDTHNNYCKAKSNNNPSYATHKKVIFMIDSVFATAYIFAGIATVLSQINHVQYSIIFSIICIGFLLFALFKIRKKHQSESADSHEVQKTIKIKLTPLHNKILEQFIIHCNQLLSASDISKNTTIERFEVQVILDELAANDLIIATNIDDFNGGWQYGLSESGIKYISTLPIN